VEHVVFFPAADGSPAFRRVPALEDAVRLVEHLRNAEGVADVTVHALGDEVPLSFRAYYRVEVPAPADVLGGPAPVPAVGPTPSPLPGLPVEPAHVVFAEAAQAIEPVAEPVVAESLAELEPVLDSLLPEQPAGEPALAVGQAPAEDGVPGNGHRDSIKSLGFFAT
jgi:hypothetical protein